MTNVAELKWSPDKLIEEVPTLSEEDKLALQKRIEALDKLLSDQKLAKYKIEVAFSRKRTGRGIYAGAVSLWESGTKYHGGGDTKLYECPGKLRGINDCVGFIPDASAGYGYLVCPKCQKVWEGKDVFGETFFKLDTRKWAEVILRFYTRLEHNADIKLKYPRIDIRTAALQEQEKQLMGEKLARARGSMESHIYPLRNIIKDSTAGADLLGRFYAFLTA